MRRSYNLIQALRLVAASMVVIVHSSFYTSERLSHRFPVYHEGANGVPLFFVISGFVMAISSIGFQTDSLGWFKFGTKRIIRIVPLYWFALTVKLLTSIFSHGLVLHSKLEPIYIIKSYMFLPAINSDMEIRPLLGVGWTLNYEVFFYSLFCCSLLMKVKPVVFCGATIIAFSFLGLFQSRMWPVELKFYTNPVMFDFVLGLLVGELAIRDWLVPSKWAVFLMVSGLALLFFPINFHVGGTFLTFIYGAAAVLVVISAVSMEGRLGSFVPRIVLFGGAMSYSLYLVHPLVAPGAPSIFAGVGLPFPFLAFVGAICIAFVAGCSVYCLVEAPLDRALTRAYSLAFAKKGGNVAIP